MGFLMGAAFLFIPPAVGFFVLGGPRFLFGKLILSILAKNGVKINEQTIFLVSLFGFFIQILIINHIFNDR